MARGVEMQPELSTPTAFAALTDDELESCDGGNVIWGDFYAAGPWFGAGDVDNHPAGDPRLGT